MFCLMKIVIICLQMPFFAHPMSGLRFIIKYLVLFHNENNLKSQAGSVKFTLKIDTKMIDTKESQSI